MDLTEMTQFAQITYDVNRLKFPIDKMTYQIQTTPLEESPEVYRIAYVANPKKIAEFEEVALKKFSHAKVSGFRQGKAPTSILKNVYRHEISQLVEHLLLNEAYQDVLFETKFAPVTYRVERAVLNGKRFECDFMIWNFPRQPLKQYRGLKVAKPKTNFDVVEQRKDEILGVLRQKHAKKVPYEADDFVQDGDEIEIAYDVLLPDEVSYKNNPSQNCVKLIAGENQNSVPQPVFDVLSGLSIGETKTCTSDEQENYWVKLASGFKLVPADLDDNLAKAAGFETFEELSKQALEAAVNQIEAEQKRKLADAVLSELFSQNPVTLPNWFVNAELYALEPNWNSLENKNQKEQIYAMAKMNCHWKVLMNEIKLAEPEVEFSHSELENVLKNGLAQMGKTKKEVEEYCKGLEEKGMMLSILEKMREDLMMNWLIDKAEIVEEVA